MLGGLDLDTFRDACYFDAFRVWQERVDATTTCACCKRMLGVSCLARLMGNRYALRAKHDSFKQPDLPTTTTYLNWLDAQDPHRLVRLHADNVDGLALTTVTCSLSDAVDKELKGGCDGKWKVLYTESLATWTWPQGNQCTKEGVGVCIHTSHPQLSSRRSAAPSPGVILGGQDKGASLE